MNEEMQEMFRQMDAMMNRIFAGMEAGFPPGMAPGVRGYHIVIHGGGPAPEDVNEAGAEAREDGEPLTEIHRIGNEVKVIAELPGVTEDSLRLSVKDGRLIVDAGDADRHYRASAVLPPVDAGSMDTTFRNGVLEVTFTAAGDGREGREAPDT